MTRRITIVEIGLIFTFLVMCAVAVLNSSFGLLNIEMVGAFSVDESTLIGNVLDLEFITPGELYYGNGYRIFTLLFLHLCKALGYHLDVQFIGMALRLQSLVFGTTAAALVFLILRRLNVSYVLSLFGAAFLFTIPDFYLWSQMVHPDTLQTTLILLAFYFVMSRHSYAAALLAASTLGFAFGTKYAGLLLMPFVFLPYAMSQWNGHASRPFHLLFKILIPRFVVLFVPFVLTFAILNPYCISHPVKLYAQLTLLKGAMWAVASYRPWKWIGTIVTQMGVLGGILLVAGLAVFFRQFGTQIRNHRLAILNQVEGRNLLTMSITTLGGLCILMLISRLYGGLRYTYFFLPLLVVMTFFAIHTVTSKINQTALTAVFFALILFRAQDCIKSVNAASHKPVSEEMRAAEFIESRYPTSTKIFKEWYAYISPKYPNVERDWHISKETVEKSISTGVSVLVFTKANSGRFAWKLPGTSIHEKKFTQDEKRSIDAAAVISVISDLLAPSSGWTIVYDTEGFLIFERKGLFSEQRISSTR